MQDGKRGYNTDAARGADTFYPFNNLNTASIKVWHYTLTQPATTYTSPIYTATEDCLLIGLFRNIGGCAIYINGEAQSFDSHGKYDRCSYELIKEIKEGDTFYGTTYQYDNGSYWSKSQQITLITVSK